MTEEPTPGAELARLVADGEEGGLTASGFKAAATALARSAKAAGAAAVVSGRWLTDTALEMAPHVPVRDLAALQAHHDGRTGLVLAEALVTNASRASAAVGAVAGAVAGAAELAPPAWVTIPVELVADTLAVAAIEMKLIAELHEVFHQPLHGASAQRAVGLVRAWTGQRGVAPQDLAGGGSLASMLGTTARKELTQALRRRLTRRLGRNLSTLAPMFAGAVAGAELNRRGTRKLGAAVLRDLADRSWPPPGDLTPRPD